MLLSKTFLHRKATKKAQKRLQLAETRYKSVQQGKNSGTLDKHQTHWADMDLVDQKSR